MHGVWCASGWSRWRLRNLWCHGRPWPCDSTMGAGREGRWAIGLGVTGPEVSTWKTHAALCDNFRRTTGRRGGARRLVESDDPAPVPQPHGEADRTTGRKVE